MTKASAGTKIQMMGEIGGGVIGCGSCSGLVRVMRSNTAVHMSVSLGGAIPLFGASTSFRSGVTFLASS